MLRHCLLVVGALWLSAASAAEIGIGLLGQFSGPYSWWGKEYQRGVDLYLESVGGKAGAHTLTVLPRDEGGTNPQRSRQLAQELVVRDKVQYLLGGTFTPTVLGVTDVATQTKTPFVVLKQLIRLSGCRGRSLPGAVRPAHTSTTRTPSLYAQTCTPSWFPLAICVSTRSCTRRLISVIDWPRVSVIVVGA